MNVKMLTGRCWNCAASFPTSSFPFCCFHGFHVGGQTMARLGQWYLFIVAVRTKEPIRAMLDECLLSDEEMAAYKKRQAQKPRCFSHQKCQWMPMAL